ALDPARDGDRLGAERDRLRARRVGPGLDRRDRSARAQVSAAPPVELRGLVKHYGEILAVDHVDMMVEPGDVFGYLGPNGAGKTTSLRMMLGLIRPTEGSVQLFGRDPLRDGAKALDGVAGFVEGPRFYPYLSGRRNLRLLADYDDGDSRSRIEEVLELVELRDRAKDKVGGYSHGMRQRLGIAAALLRSARPIPSGRASSASPRAGSRRWLRATASSPSRPTRTRWPRSRSRSARRGSRSRPSCPSRRASRSSS